MHGVLLTEHGGPEVLRYQALPDPEAAGRVTVEIRAAGINRRDALIREGRRAHYRPKLPVVLGSDAAGVRRDTGEEVIVLPSLHWGENEAYPADGFRVLGGGPEGGTYAELVAVPEENLFPKPSRLAWPEAGTIALSGLTAYRALFTVGGLRPGQTVVILGAGSGVSTLALQLAMHSGARVAVTSSSQDKIELAKDLGAVAGVDYTRQDWELELRDEIGEADLVLDSVGSTIQESLMLLRKGGAVVNMGGTGEDGMATLDVRTLYLPHKRILGTAMGSARDFAGYLAMTEDAALDPVVEAVYPLDEAVEAHEHLDSNLRFGKLVLSTQ